MKMASGTRLWLWCHSMAIFVLLYAPLVLVAAYSLATGGRVSGWHGMTLTWYRQLFQDAGLVSILWRSFWLAGGSATVATCLGTLLAYGMYRYKLGNLLWLGLLIYLPMILPDVAFGIAQMLFFHVIHHNLGLFPLSFWTVFIAHVTFQIPFVALTVHAVLSRMDPALLDAAFDLYANPVQAFVKVVWPLIWPGVLGGFLLAVTLSVDDFGVSFFTTGPDAVTLPIYIYSAVTKRGVTPEINAVATLLVGVVAVLALANGISRSITARRAEEVHQKAGMMGV